MLPDWPPEEIEAYICNVDWTAVSESLIGQYNGLQLTTPNQFRLMLQYNTAADHFFQNYSHAWGINALAALEIPRWRVTKIWPGSPRLWKSKLFRSLYNGRRPAA